MIKSLIKTEEDYNLALTRLEDIFDAKKGSNEANEAELLITLVNIYEAKEYPIELPHPIEAIKIRMEEKNLKPTQLASELNISKGTLSDILNMHKPLSLQMIRRIKYLFNIPANVLIQEYSLKSKTIRTASIEGYYPSKTAATKAALIQLYDINYQIVTPKSGYSSTSKKTQKRDSDENLKRDYQKNKLQK